ncbi:MAG: penicillin-binding protein activator, partial [Gammaproteobacteria bacterium]|nr:penicillin-binding protein activator [Gammaproteobacteria bacterium]
MKIKLPILPRPDKLIQALCCLCLLAVVAGCETPGPRGTGSDLASRAEAAMESGDYRRAAQSYERLAARASAEERKRWLLAAAEAWYFADERNRAMRNMREVGLPLAGDLTNAQSVLAAALEVESGEPQQALDRLRDLPPGVARSLAADALAVGSSAWFRLDDVTRGTRLLVERETWLENADQILANQRRLWEALRSAGPVDVADDSDAIVRGWIELSNAVAAYAGDPFAERAAMLRWREQWPGHPADAVLLERLLGDYQQSLRTPQRVALLLPLSGQVGQAGAALRDGFIAGHLDYGAMSGTRVVVYDTELEGAATSYRRAVEDGADFIVGPLIKDDVQAVLPLAPAGPPTLALNYLPTQIAAPRNFYQFALAPEHEARRVAQRAVAEGRTRAIALVPGNDWGQRVLTAFSMELEDRGGTLLTHATYDPSETDFSNAIKSALLLDRSYSRRRQISATIGQELEFEPRRRQDVDFIFVGAFARQARLMRPQLRFHYATGLPVYATASAYTANADLNRDINGVIFAVTPWELGTTNDTLQLQETIERFWPGRTDAGNPLYAM